MSFKSSRINSKCSQNIRNTSEARTDRKNKVYQKSTNEHKKSRKLNEWQNVRRLSSAGVGCKNNVQNNTEMSVKIIATIQALNSHTPFSQNQKNKLRQIYTSLAHVTKKNP